MSITLNKNRIGNFTSSEIYNLLTLAKNGKDLGKAALTYIEECNFERKLGRSLSSEINARPLIWGKLCEKRVFDCLGLEYTECSTETIVHPEIPYWAGSADGIKHVEKRTCIDVKCPITLKSFCQFADALSMLDVRTNHKDGEKYYWQIVSNAILNNCDEGELVVYVPYQSELPTIRDMAINSELKTFFIMNGEDVELPYLIDGGYYKNINKIGFEIPQSDKDLLTDTVQRAGKLLINI